MQGAKTSWVRVSTAPDVSVGLGDQLIPQQAVNTSKFINNFQLAA